MQKKAVRISLVLAALLPITYFIFTLGRPAPIPVKRELFDGVTYHRVVHYLPHSMIAHVLVIDTKVNGMQFLVTPPVDEEAGTTTARTTSQFLEEFDVQIAINGDG